MPKLKFFWLLILAGLASPAAADEAAYKALTGEIVEAVILPAHREFDRAAQDQAVRMAALCEDPNATALAAAQVGFSDLVVAFSAVEFYRFGPARDQNRFERLFYWPDRKGRGLRQVQALIAKQDQTGADPDRLAGKSVAVQGLLALDFVLAGTGSDALAAGADSHRCRYGRAIADRIAAVAGDLLADWSGPGGYGALLRNPGHDNPIYRSHAEALQELLRAYAEQLQIVHGFKLSRVVLDAPEKAKPKRAPFWRSGNWMPMVIANLTALETLFSGLAIESHLPEQQSGLADQLLFELKQARQALTRAGAPGRNGRSDGAGRGDLGHAAVQHHSG